MTKFTDEEMKDVEKIKDAVYTLCEQAPPQIVIALAATTLDWNVVVDKSQGKDAVVDGLIVGTDAFLKRHQI